MLPFRASEWIVSDLYSTIILVFPEVPRLILVLLGLSYQSKVAKWQSETRLFLVSLRPGANKPRRRLGAVLAYTHSQMMIGGILIILSSGAGRTPALPVRGYSSYPARPPEANE
jgi:hypothetical protein